MPQTQQVQVATVILASIAVIILAVGWYAFGMVLQRNRWLYRAHRLLSLILYITLLAALLYVALGPGQDWLR